MRIANERLRFINQEFGIPKDLERNKAITDFVDKGLLHTNAEAKQMITEQNIKLERYEALEEAIRAFAALVAEHIRR